MTPEEEDRVRRALADAGESWPVPPLPDAVAARLDATLAGLVEDRASGTDDTTADPSGPSAAPSGTPTDTPVVGDELAARRRRRWPRLLVAAAAVCVVGYGAGAVVTGVSGSGGAASSDAGGAAPEAADKYVAGGDATVSQGEVLAARPARLSRATLAADLQRLVDGSPALRRSARSDGVYTQSDRDAPKTVLDGCALPASRPGDTLTAVRLDGRAATLLLEAERDGVRVAQIHSCGDPARVLASSRVRVP